MDLSLDDESDLGLPGVEVSVMELWDNVVGLAILMWAVGPLRSTDLHFPQSRTQPTLH